MATSSVVRLEKYAEMMLLCPRTTVYPFQYQCCFSERDYAIFLALRILFLYAHVKVHWIIVMQLISRSARSQTLKYILTKTTAENTIHNLALPTTFVNQNKKRMKEKRYMLHCRNEFLPCSWKEILARFRWFSPWKLCSYPPLYAFQNVFLLEVR